MKKIISIVIFFVNILVATLVLKIPKLVFVYAKSSELIPYLYAWNTDNIQ